MKKKLIMISAIIALIAAVSIFTGCGSAEEENADAEVIGTCTLTIQDVCENQEMDIHEGDTVFDILQAADVPIAAEDTGDGMEVEAINGVEEEDSAGWLVYVNGEMPMVYSDKLTVNDGDSIEWEFGEYEDMQM